MAFKLKMHPDNADFEEVDFEVEQINKGQININISRKDVKQATIVIYEAGGVYIDGRDAGNWRD